MSSGWGLVLPFNANQRRILFVACVLFAFSSMCVPWKVSREDGSHIHLAPLGYSLIFDPPDGLSCVVDLTRLLLTWTTLAGVTGALVLLAATQPRRPDQA